MPEDTVEKYLPDEVDLSLLIGIVEHEFDFTFPEGALEEVDTVEALAKVTEDLVDDDELWEIFDFAFWGLVAEVASGEYEGQPSQGEVRPAGGLPGVAFFAAGE